MASSLSILVNNVTEKTHTIKFKYRHDNKKFETCGIKSKAFECCSKYKNDDLIVYKCLCSNNQLNFDVNLKKRFANTYEFSNNNINKLILLFGEDIYSREYVNDWQKLNEASSPEKEDFYSHLNMEVITDTDYAHGNRVYKDF